MLRQTETGLFLEGRALDGAARGVLEIGRLVERFERETNLLAESPYIAPTVLWVGKLALT